MKELKKILLLVLLFIASTTIVNAKTIKLKECEYTDAYIKWLELDEKEREQTIMPAICKNNMNNKYSMLGSSINGVSINDTKFDLRDYEKITSVKDQGETGACWAFSTNAAIESNLLMNEFGEYDLSEAHLELSTQNTYDYGRKTFSRKTNTGGSADWTALAYFMNGWGPVEESYLPFQKLVDLYDNKGTIESNLITSNESLFDINKVTLIGNGEGACTSNDLESVKKYLISEGAITAAIYSGKNQAEKYRFYDGKAFTKRDGTEISADKSIDHAITIVGWDDSISKDKFNGATRDGAFIIKNSWGTKSEFNYKLSYLKQYCFVEFEEELKAEGITEVTNVPNEFVINFISKLMDISEEQITIDNDSIYLEIGNNGYQYISYDDIHVCNILTGFTDIDNKSEDNNYGYTNLGSNSAFGNESLDTMYTMSKYTKKSNRNEILKEVVTIFTGPGMKYTIYFADKDTNVITDAEVVAQGTSLINGMETIRVNNKTITSDKFTIFIKLENENGVHFTATSTPNITFNNPFSGFESTPEVEFISADAMTYSDVSDQKFNLALKINTNLESTDEDVNNTPVNPPASDDEDNNDTPINPPAGDDEDNNDTPINPPAGDDEDNNDTPINPPAGDDEDNNDTPVNPPVSDDDYPEINEDDINTDGKIEIEENEYNKEHKDEKLNQNVDQPTDNPKTGLYIPIFIIGLIGVSIIAIRRNMKSKVYKI